MESARIREFATGHSDRIEAIRGDNPSVIVVDDVSSDWTRLGTRLEATGIGMTVTEQQPEYLLRGRPSGILCLILGARPGLGRLDFQRRLLAAEVVIPIIFVAESGDISMSVAAMKNGVIDFLGRSCSDEELHQSIEIGLARDRAWSDQNRRLSTLKHRYDTLTDRESEVMWLVATGRLNKQIGGDLGISEITVKAHRARMMRKLGATNVPELTRMTDEIAQIVEQPNMRLESESNVGSPQLLPPPFSSELPFFETKGIVRLLPQYGRTNLGGQQLVY